MNRERCSLRGLIRKSGLSYEDISERARVPVSTVEDWVEWRSVPSVEECIQLAELLDIDLYYVYLALITP